MQQTRGKDNEYTLLTLNLMQQTRAKDNEVSRSTPVTINVVHSHPKFPSFGTAENSEPRIRQFYACRRIVVRISKAYSNFTEDCSLESVNQCSHSRHEMGIQTNGLRIRSRRRILRCSQPIPTRHLSRGENSLGSTLWACSSWPPCSSTWMKRPPIKRPSRFQPLLSLWWNGLECFWSRLGLDCVSIAYIVRIVFVCIKS